MDSPQSIVSPLKTPSVFPEEQENQSKQSVEVNCKGNSQSSSPSEKEESSSSIGGALEVYIDQARDIHNICIYQKQDVYAKLSLTSNPENAISTKTVNGGGRNPVFDETLRLSIPKADASLKCEVWMMSRVRNYLEDQLLGFALVPLSEILLHDGKLEGDFSLSSTDLFHSPAGFVRLSVAYLGKPPEVVPVAVTPRHVSGNGPCDLDKIEFPDPHVLKENQSMVEEYFKLSRNVVELDHSSEGSDSSSLMKVVLHSPTESPSTSKDDSKPLDDGVNGSKEDGGGAKGSAVGLSVEPPADEPKVVQQDIVDMYMKSMQQFTESLAKMKLPMLDVDSGPAGSDVSSSELKSDGSNKNISGSRVFYGSRAFF